MLNWRSTVFATEAIALSVPYAQRHSAQAAGARWDPHARGWYAPPGVDTGPLAGWLIESAPLPDGPRVPAAVCVMAIVCYRCGRDTAAVVGLLVDPDLSPDGSGFVFYEEVAEALSVLLDTGFYDRHGVGLLAHRRSSVRPEGYMANGCRHCGAILGNFPLWEDLVEYLGAGGDLDELAVGHITIPAALFAPEDLW